MSVKFVILPTDIVVAVLLAALAFYVVRALKTEQLRARWSLVFSSAVAVCSAVLLSFFLLIAALDSVHFRVKIAEQDAAPVYSARALSLLDLAAGKASEAEEKTYSVPLASRTFEKISSIQDGKPVRDYERLRAGGAHLKDEGRWLSDVLARVGLGLAGGLAATLLLSLFCAALVAVGQKKSFKDAWRTLLPSKRGAAAPYAFATVALLTMLVALVMAVWPYYHVLGTDQTGNDILYQALKSVRTAIVIGALATLTTLPFAVILGVSAGYFKGWVDDVIQYIYTTLSSIPSVLLIAAAVLMIQVFIDSHPGLYATGLERADLRLFMLSVIIGLTGWATLARLLRAETLKISELDYVQAAKAFGVGPFSIMRRHVFPNVVHIVLIVAVLDFSGIVLYEAVLSYVGVGVDPATNSFGSMINAGRLELSRTPVVWWNLFAAFLFMLTMVLSANLFASKVREAFDPRADIGGKDNA